MRAFLGSVVALGLAVSAPMASAQTAPGTTSTQGIKAGVYQVDPDHTQVFAKYMHLGFNPTYIFFGEPSGSLTLAPAKLANRSEERRIGKECVSQCRSQWSAKHYKKNKVRNKVQVQL